MCTSSELLGFDEAVLLRPCIHFLYRLMFHTYEIGFIAESWYSLPRIISLVFTLTQECMFYQNLYSQN